MLILATLLTNCSSVKKLSIFKQEVPRAELNLDKPTALQLEQIKWIIITSDNAEEVFNKMKEQGLDPVLFGLNDNCLLYTSPSPRDHPRSRMPSSA